MVGGAVISDHHCNIHRITDGSSIFTADGLVLYFVRTCDTNNTFIIFSDLLSVLKAMNNTSANNQL